MIYENWTKLPALTKKEKYHEGRKLVYIGDPSDFCMCGEIVKFANRGGSGDCYECYTEDGSYGDICLNHLALLPEINEKRKTALLESARYFYGSMDAVSPEFAINIAEEFIKEFENRFGNF